MWKAEMENSKLQTCGTSTGKKRLLPLILYIPPVYLPAFKNQIDWLDKIEYWLKEMVNTIKNQLKFLRTNCLTD